MPNPIVKLPSANDDRTPEFVDIDPCYVRVPFWTSKHLRRNPIGEFLEVPKAVGGQTDFKACPRRERRLKDVEYGNRVAEADSSERHGGQCRPAESSTR
jgi:hypothetical protein